MNTDVDHTTILPIFGCAELGPHVVGTCDSLASWATVGALGHNLRGDGGASAPVLSKEAGESALVGGFGHRDGCGVGRDRNRNALLGAGTSAAGRVRRTERGPGEDRAALRDRGR